MPPDDQNCRDLIRRIVDQAPPLSEHQRARLATLLQPATGSDDPPPVVAETVTPQQEAA